MKTKDSVLEHLTAIPLFSACSKKQLAHLRSLLTEIVVPAGKVLVREGSTGYECFIIVSGHTEVTIQDELITRFGPGDYFGELSLLDKQPRSASVTAVTECSVVVLSQKEFTQALEETPGLAIKIMANLATRLRETNRRSLEH